MQNSYSQVLFLLGCGVGVSLAGTKVVLPEFVDADENILLTGKQYRHYYWHAALLNVTMPDDCYYLIIVLIVHQY